MLSRRQLLASGAFGFLGSRAAGAAPPAAPSPALPLVIDTHAHVWKVDARFPFARSATGATLPPPDRDATPEALLALMKANGVRKTVLVQVSHHGWDHSYLIDTLRRHPGAFFAMARVNPEDPAAPDQLEQLTRQHGFRGLRLNVQPAPAFDWVRGPLLPPLLARCESLGIPLGLQTKAARLSDLLRLCERFPRLTVIIDHMADLAPGDAKGIEALLAFTRLPRVFVKLSHTWMLGKQPWPYADAQTLAKRVYDGFGPRRLLFASDWPGVDKFCGYTRTLALIDVEMKFLNAEDKKWIFARNAASIWKGVF